MFGLSWEVTGWWIAVVTVLFTALFLVYPDIDLWVSTRFYDLEGGFVWQHNAVFQFIRMTLIYLLALFGLASVAMLLRSWAIGKRRAVAVNVWGFIVTTFLVGPLFLANSVLKTYWGRARPRDVAPFGGDSAFTPPWLMTDQCDVNCSFVSGEGSALAAGILVLAIVVGPNLRGIWRWIAGFVVLPLMLFGIALRVIVGAHFFSDTLFAILLMALVTWVFYGLFNIQNYRHDLTWTNLKKDLSKPQ